ncbi:putative phosphatidylserine decarboxylase [Helicobacter mustelae]|uniref:hypothetical protein n=1 Tax=Helicobacter mustelae TaxID=217 RepID=UPI000DFEF07E|nr:hypothetical protein [Helicobacter mustelae]STP12123.1 putative phosphatidylserine decarboxylase [Helicobacter mustelae]
MVRTQFLAKEGFKGLGIGILIFLVAFLLDLRFLLFFLLIFLAMWIFIFRNPERFASERGEGVVLAPSDGKITDIRYQSGLVYISIAIDWVDVGLLRAPYDARNISFKIRHGLRASFVPEATKEKVNQRMYYQSEDFDMIIEPEIFQANFYPLPYALTGDRIGFCKLGRLQVVFKENFLDLRVSIGDVLRGGETLLGYKK